MRKHSGTPEPRTSSCRRYRQRPDAEVPLAPRPERLSTTDSTTKSDTAMEA